MPSTTATFELDLDVKEDTNISDKLLKDYQVLNEKLDQTIVKIKNKRKKPTK